MRSILNTDRDRRSNGSLYKRPIQCRCAGAAGSKLRTTRRVERLHVVPYLDWTSNLTITWRKKGSVHRVALIGNLHVATRETANHREGSVHFTFVKEGVESGFLRSLKDAFSAHGASTTTMAMRRAGAFENLSSGAALAVMLFLHVVIDIPARMVAAAWSSAASDVEFLNVLHCPAGSDTRMTCGIKEHHAYHMNSSDVQWYFKPCGGGFQQMPCSNREELEEHEWHPLNCDDKRCHVTLTIQNASEVDAGLYRCTVHPYRTDNRTQLDIQLRRTFQLVVTKSFLDESIPAPELLDNLPANTTAIVNTQIVLQCRVHSKVQPTIKWFRRIDKQLGEHSFNQNKSIRYLENSYELVPSAGEKLLSHDVYLSKLILYSASERDIGIYVCVGINYGGVSMADAYVNLLHPNGTPLEESHGRYVDLMVLFLIPIALALVPLFAWIVLNVIRASHHSEEKALVQFTGATSYEPPGKGEKAKRRSKIEGMHEHVYDKINIV